VIGEKGIRNRLACAPGMSLCRWKCVGLAGGQIYLGAMIEKQFCIEFIDELLMKSHCGGRRPAHFTAMHFRAVCQGDFFSVRKMGKKKVLPALRSRP